MDWTVVGVHFSRASALAHEKALILRHKTYLPEYGYNSTMGGEGILSNEETRRKIGLGNKGKRVSLEVRRRISNSMKGVQKSDETRRRMSASRKGVPRKPLTPDQENRRLAALRAKLRGKPLSKHIRDQVSRTLGGKPFKVQVVKTGQRVGTWTNQNEAARTLNIPSTTVNACLRGRQQTARGFVFSYLA